VEEYVFLKWRVGSYRGTSLIRNCLLLGPYSRPMPRVLWCSYGGGLFLMSEGPLYVLPQGPRTCLGPLRVKFDRIATQGMDVDGWMKKQ